MSDFWNNNKDSIKSGLTSAGKYGYQGTKYIAKSGYNAGKKHYNNNKDKGEGKPKEGEQTDVDSEYSSATPIRCLKDPSSFPPPPLRSEQMQYNGGGNLIVAETRMAGQNAGTNPKINQQPPQAYSNQNHQLYKQPPQEYQQPPQQVSTGQLPPPPPQRVIQPTSQNFSSQEQSTHVEQYPFQTQYGSQQQVNQYVVNEQETQPNQLPSQNQIVQQLQERFNVKETVTAISTSASDYYDMQATYQNNSSFQESNQNPGQYQASVIKATYQHQYLNDNSSLPSVIGRPQLPIPCAASAQFNGDLGELHSNASYSTTVPSVEQEVSESIQEWSGYTPVSVPQYELKPFDYEDAEKNKGQKKINIENIDVTVLLPPPTHRDRSKLPSTGMPPSYISTSHSITGNMEHANHTKGEELPSKLCLPSESSDQETDKGTLAEISSTPPGEQIEPSKPSITSRYNNDSSTSFQPPPKPYRAISDSNSLQGRSNRNVDQNRGVPAQQPRATQQLAKSGSVPPPVIPQRLNTADIQEVEDLKISTVNFPPPPRPTWGHQSNIPQNLNGKSVTGSNYSRLVHDSSKMLNISRTESFSETNLEPFQNFPPPPKPFRKTESSESLMNVSPQIVAHVPTVPENKIIMQDDESTRSTINITPEDHLQKKKASHPVVKPKPKNLVGKTAVKDQEFNVKPNDIEFVLAKMKSNRNDTEKMMDNSKSTKTTAQPIIKLRGPPPVPKKKDLLRNNSPHVPIKSHALRSNNGIEDTASTEAGFDNNDDSNPFERYMKNAVPNEDDRLHKS